MSLNDDHVHSAAADKQFISTSDFCFCPVIFSEIVNGNLQQKRQTRYNKHNDPQHKSSFHMSEAELLRSLVVWFRIPISQIDVAIYQVAHYSGCEVMSDLLIHSIDQEKVFRKVQNVLCMPNVFFASSQDEFVLV